MRDHSRFKKPFLLKYLHRLFILLSLTPAIWIVSINTAFAQNRTYQTKMLNHDAPEINGIIDEPAWEIVEWSGNFTQRAPYENQPPSQQTSFKILYDDNNLYVAIKAFDTEVHKIEKRLTRRDKFEGDWVAIGIDSYNDKLTAFVFSVNVSGVKGDLIITNDTEEDETWDPVWYVKTKIVADGWIAEMKIPLSQLRFAKKETYAWGLEVSRKLFRKEEFSLWQMVPQEASGWVSMWGELHGISNIKPNREVELVPYAMGKFETNEKEEGNPYITGTDWGYNIGMDAKVAVTNDLTLNITVNPDFGQVEADPSEVNLTAFESFFKEKRPFFVEGNNIYNYQITNDGDAGLDNLFYSRRIGRRPGHEPEIKDGEYMSCPEFTRILGAVKLSGKTQNGWSIGVLESLTNEEKAEIDAEGKRRKEIIEPLTNYFNARIQKDFNKGKTIAGGMVTATNRFIHDSTLNYLPSSAYTGGADFTQFWKDKAYYFGLKTVFSQIYGKEEAITDLQESPQRYYQRPDATHLSVDTTRISLFGHGGTIEGGKIGQGHWRYGGWITWRSPGLELNDMGFLREADIVQQVFWGGYRIWEPFSIFRRMNINVAQWSGWDFAGSNIYTGYNFNVNTQFKNYWRFGTGVNRNGKSISRSELRGGPELANPGRWNNWLNIRTDERKKLSFSAFLFNSWGDQDYRRSVDFGVGISYRPFDFLQFSIQPGYGITRREAIYIETIELTDENRYLVSYINQEMASADLRIDVSITPDLSIQFWGQPFVFSGNYSDFMKVVNPGATKYIDQFYKFSDAEITYGESDNIYYVDENQDGQTDYQFDNPDFSFFEFRSNLVIRWEYLPGSTAYLVWSQGRTGDHPDGQFSLSENINHLSAVTPHNVFLLKVSLRFSF